MLEVGVAETDSLRDSRCAARVHDERLRIFAGTQASHRHFLMSFKVRGENHEAGDMGIIGAFPGRHPQVRLAVLPDIFEVRGSGPMVYDQQGAVQEQSAKIRTKIFHGIRKCEDDTVTGAGSPGS